MAEGPMPTPRRSWPRSMVTPKIPAGLRALSNKRHAPRASRVGGGLEEPLRGATHGVDPAEVHRGFLVDEHLLVAVEVVRAGAGLVSEEVALGVEARGEDRRLQRHPEVQHVDQGLEYGGGDPGGAGGAQGYDAALLGKDRWAHAGDQALPWRQRMEAPRVQLRLSQGVVHRDAGAGDHEPRTVAHGGGDRDDVTLVVHAGGVRGVRRAEDAPTLFSGVLLAGQALR